MLCLAVKESLVLYQADVKCAFLRSEVDKEIYITRPEGYRSKAEYFRLISSVYGLRQSPRCFYREMREILAPLGFIPCEVDPCVFIGPKEQRAALILYVDDMVTMGKSESFIKSFLDTLGQELELTYRPLDCFLGIQVETIPDGLFLHQRSYIEQLLERYNMTNSRGASCPISRRSVTGIMIHSAGGCIIYKSSLQKSTTLSSCEAELSALSSLAQTAQFIRRLLMSLDIHIVPNLRCDNLATISLATAENQLFSRSKHISVKEFYVRELVEAGDVTVQHVSSQFNYSDCLTKPHNSPTFLKLLQLINFGPPPQNHGSHDMASAAALLVSGRFDDDHRAAGRHK